MDEPVMVSVLCTVYNHEKYLRQCLDGFVTQKTNFRYEVIIHDDASTDRSADIIREYERNYPDIIRPIYQTENQYSQKVSISNRFLLPIARGKYIATCEGDDYWCDENKLQMQFEAMEAHPDCRFCVHKVLRIHESGRPLDRYCPPSSVPVEEGVLTPGQYLKAVGTIFCFQLSSYFRRADDVRKYQQDPPEFAKVSDVGDEAMMLYWPLLGNVYYIDRVMSCYREFSVGSWTAKRKESLQAQLPHDQAMVAMYDAFNEYTDHKYEELVRPRRRLYYLKCCLIEIDKGDNARILCKKENRDFMARRSRKHKLYVFLKAYVPIFANFYGKTHGQEFR